MPTLSWIIERLLVKPTEGAHTNVVVTADWRCNGTETVGDDVKSRDCTGTCYGSTSFTAPSGDFTPYPDLTKDQVLGWCFSNGINKTAIEANVTAQINDQINPPVVCLPNPWVPALVTEETVVSNTAT